jgi:hypothetical protein
VIKYAQQGARVYANSTTNIYPTIANNRFTENNIGLQLYTFSTGDVRSPVNNNVFSNNSVAVLVAKNGTVTGKTWSIFTNNDFSLPSPLTRTNAVSVTSVGSVISAPNNYWGHITGPYHITINVSGQGVFVTNTAGSTVILSPWGAAPYAAPVSYAILGRVALEGDTPIFPLPLAGVSMLLNTGVVTSTNLNGGYNFDGLSSGSYTVRPILSGYSFSPTQRVVNIAGADGTGIDFIAKPVLGQTYSIAGTVRDRDGNPIPNAFVYATNASAGDMTDGNGDYLIANVVPNTYRLVVNVSGYAPFNFLPTYRDAAVIDTNLTGQDFQLAVVTFTPYIRK